MPPLEVIKAHEGSKKLLLDLSTKYHMSQAKFIKLALQYFKTTGYSPMDTDLAELKQMIAGMSNRIIAFYKKIEKEQLKPLLERSDASITLVAQYLQDQQFESESFPDALHHVSKNEKVSTKQDPFAIKKKVDIEDVGHVQSNETRDDEQIRLQVEHEKLKKNYDELLDNIRFIAKHTQEKGGFGKGYILQISESDYLNKLDVYVR